MRRDTNNQPSNALTLYADPNNLESYANNRSNNINSIQGNTNHAYDKNYLSNSRADYNNNINGISSNANYTFPAGTNSTVPNVQEVI